MKDVLKIAFALSLVLALYSCDKDSNEAPSSTFIKVYDSGKELIARGAFQKQNADLVLFGISNETPAQSATFGTVKSEINICSENGVLKKRLEVPSEIHALWEGAELVNGDMVFAGFDSLQRSSNIGLVLYDSNGNMKAKTSIYNYVGYDPNNTNAADFDPNYMDMVVLEDGKICISTISFNLAFLITSPYKSRIIILNPDLSIAGDREFNQDLIISNRQAYARQISNGNIVLSENKHYPDADSTWFTLYEFSVPDLNLVESTVFKNAYPTSNYHFNNNHLFLSGVGWIDREEVRNFELRNLEGYSIAQAVEIYTPDQINIIDTYPGYGYLSNFVNTSDGGFIGVGTCNILVGQILSIANCAVIVTKFQADGTESWTKIINPKKSLIGASISETKNGYLIAATSLGNDYKLQLALLQTDFNGNL